MQDSDRLIFTCADCGEIHQGLPALVFDAPAQYFELPEAERDARAELTSDTCVIDESLYFVRTVLCLPIQGTSDHLEWGIWGSLSEANFERFIHSYDSRNQRKLGPMFSWLASVLPGYQSTLNIKTMIHPQDGGLRPYVELDPSSPHQLALDARQGLTAERAIEFARPVLHPQRG